MSKSFEKSLLSFIAFLCMSVLFACLRKILCTVYMQEPIEARGGHQTPGTRVTDGSELPGLGAGN